MAHIGATHAFRGRAGQLKVGGKMGKIRWNRVSSEIEPCLIEDATLLDRKAGPGRAMTGLRMVVRPAVVNHIEEAGCPAL